MSNLNTIADAIANLLSDFNAEVAFSPEFELRDLVNKRCVVVPITSESKSLCRNKQILETTYRIEVGFLVRGKNLNLSHLTSQVRIIAKRCLHFTVGNARCIQAEPTPLYDQEQLRQRNQFTSVTSLVFKEISNG